LKWRVRNWREKSFGVMAMAGLYGIPAVDI
jgi:hypothetical protein